MKNLTMINIFACAGLVLAPLGATASEFGGGWTRDKNSGTLSNSNAPTVEQHGSSSAGSVMDGYGNEFGGGWARNPNTGTIYYSDAPSVEQHGSTSAKKNSGGNMGSTSGTWARNYMFSSS